MDIETLIDQMIDRALEIDTPSGWTLLLGPSRDGDGNGLAYGRTYRWCAVAQTTLIPAGTVALVPRGQIDESGTPQVEIHGDLATGRISTRNLTRAKCIAEKRPSPWKPSRNYPYP